MKNFILINLGRLVVILMIMWSGVVTFDVLVSRHQYTTHYTVGTICNKSIFASECTAPYNIEEK